MLGFLRRHFVENPLAGRMLATTMTGPRLGGAFLIVNGVLFIVYLTLFVNLMGSRSVDGTDAGPLICFCHSVALYYLLSLLLPIKLSGHIEGLRLGKAFDQFVVTGSSPLTLLMGSWSMGLVYALLILLVTLPFAGCAYIFGGVSVLQLVGAYGVLLLYSNVIIACTLALSVFEREWVTVPTVVGSLWLLGLFGLITDSDWIWGYPAHLAEITPTRLFLRQVVPGAPYLAPNRYQSLLTGDPVFFSTPIPLSVYPSLLWGLIVAGSLALITLGPAHRFIPGFNNFGAVVLPGDRRKRILRRLRAALNRRVEMAFFYENRPSWCARWEFPLRLLLTMVFVVFVSGVGIGRIYLGSFTSSRLVFYNDEEMLGSITLTCGALAVWILSWCDPNYKIYWRERIASLSLPRELLILLCFLALAAGLFMAHHGVLQGIEAYYKQSVAASGAQVDAARLDGYVKDWWNFFPGILLFLFNMLLFSRLASRATRNVFFPRVTAVIAGLFLFLAPILIAVLAERGEIPEAFAGVGALSPMVLVDDIRPLPWSLGERSERYFATHGTLCCLLLGLLVLLHGIRLSKARRSSALSLAGGAAVILSALVAAPRSSAQDLEEPRVEAKSALEVRDVLRGFDGRVFADGPDFLAVILRNTSVEAVRGRFWVRAEYGYWRSREQTFEIGPRTTRVFRWDRWLAGAGWYAPGSHELRVVFEAPGTRVVTEPRSLQIVSQGARSRTKGATRNHACLIVGKKKRLPLDWVQQWMGGNTSHAAECSSLALPQHPMSYLGLSAVFIGPEDLSRWTEKQRTALYDYARLGGTVIFHGGFEQSGLAGAGIWGEILQSTSSRQADSGGAFFRLEDLEDGRDLLEVQDPESRERLPLLSVRSVGAGAVGHLSFDIGDPRLPDYVESGAFWRRFAESLPASSFPFVVSSPYRYQRLLADTTSLNIILLYLAVYSLVVALGLIFFFRRKRRRQFMWFAIPAVSLLSLAAIPVLNAILHTNPSFGAFREVAYASAGSTRGAVLGHLRIRSSGRQRHSLSLVGDDPRIFDVWTSGFRHRYAGGMLGATQLVSLPEEGNEGYGMELTIPPWASRDQFLLSTLRLEAPLRGEAILDRNNGTLTCRASLPPDADEKHIALITFGFGGSNDLKKHEIQPAIDEEGFFEKTIPVNFRPDPDATRQRYRGVHTLQMEGAFSLRWGDASRPRVALAWIPKRDSRSALRLSSSDVAFEREVSESLSRRLKTRAYGYSIVERDGRHFHDFHLRLFLLELPLEVR